MTKRPATEADISTGAAAIERATSRLIAPALPYLPRVKRKETTVTETTTTIDLAYPLNRGSVTVPSLKLRRVKVGDLNAMDDLPPGTKPRRREMFLLSRLADVPPEMLEDMDAADYAKVVEALESFFVGAPPAGGSTSFSSDAPPAGATAS